MTQVTQEENTTGIQEDEVVCLEHLPVMIIKSRKLPNYKSLTEPRTNHLACSLLQPRPFLNSCGHQNCGDVYSLLGKKDNLTANDNKL